MRNNFRTLVATTLGLTLGCAMLAPTSYASTLAVPSSADPALLDKILQRPLFEAPKAQVPLAIDTSTAQKEPDNAKDITFVLKDVQITGNTVYSQKKLAKYYKSLVGKKTSLDQFYKIAEEMTVMYRQDGYVLSRAYIPPQEISNGTVKIDIVEGHVGKVEFKGKALGDEKFLRSYAKEIQASKPLQVKVLERYSLLANDLPGLTVRTVLAPSKTTPGAADVIFYTEAKRFSAYTLYNNYGTEFIGPQQWYLGASVNNAIAKGSETGLRFVAAPNDEMRYYQLYHDQFVGHEGLQFGFDAIFNDTKPGGSLRDAHVVGDSRTFNFGAQYPLIRTRSENWLVNSKMHYLNSRSKLDDTGELLYKDSIRTLDIGTTYNFADKYWGYNNFEGSMTQGFDILGASGNSRPSDEPASRYGGSSQFTKFNALASRTQQLLWHFSALFEATGQYSSKRLLSSEEFTFGGTEYGTAFDPAQFTADSGIASKIEARWTMPQSYIAQVQPYLVYSYGLLWDQDAEKDLSDSRQTASSAGAGLRLRFTKNFHAGFEVSKPLINELTDETADGGNAKGWQGFFSIGANY